MEKIIYLPQVIEYIEELNKLLYQKDYFGYLDSAENYVNAITYYAERKIPLSVGKLAPIYFKRYFATHYVTYKPNKTTNWYIFYTQKDNRYIVTFINNNHVSAHFIRGLK